MKNIASICIGIIIVTMSFASCRKFIELDPPTNAITDESVFNEDATAVSVMTGIYSKLSNRNILANYTFNASSFWAGLLSDEYTLWAGVDNELMQSYYKNKLSERDQDVPWGYFYEDIYKCNSIIEGLVSSSLLSTPVRDQLLGEAKFMRALTYFYLVNFYGPVPLTITSDYIKNSTLPRAEEDLVYSQIEQDLNESIALLSDTYLDGSLLSDSEERVRPTKWAAKSLLARMYLYRKNWTKAEQISSEIIDNKSLFDTVPVDLVFLKNSKEAIWQLQPVAYGANTSDGQVFTIPEFGLNSQNPVYLSSTLVTAFEPQDLRKSHWIKFFIDSTVSPWVQYPYAYKYKVSTLGQDVSEYQMIFRISEQYLIRAESKVQQDKLQDGVADLNIIRARAGLMPMKVSDKSDLLDAVIRERRLEFFSEMGHRWLDLKRNGLLDKIMSQDAQRKKTTWAGYAKLLPIPLREMQNNVMLSGNQNPGY